MMGIGSSLMTAESVQRGESPELEEEGADVVTHEVEHPTEEEVNQL